MWRDLSLSGCCCYGKVGASAACFSKANKQARLVERKVCFISDASSLVGGGDGGHLSKGQLPTAEKQWGKRFFRLREGAPCRNSTVSSVGRLQIGLLVSGAVNLQFQS